MMRVTLRLLATILAIVAFSGCAQQVDDIDRTQPNKLRKSDLAGVWYLQETVTSVPSTSVASFVGETGKTEKIRFEVQQDLLLAYRAYELVPGSENVDVQGGDGKDNPVAAFRILSHFDVQREYNAATGEQSNVLVENSWDKAWYDRSWMRVDWSRNVLTNFDFASEWLATPIEASYSIEAERLFESSIFYERDAAGQLVYFDVPQRLLVEPDYYGCIISSPWYGWGTEDCTASEVEIVTAFARTEPQRDYEPLPYSDQDLTRFGYFRSERYVHDQQRGVLESTRSRMANRFNIWKASYQRDSKGEYVRNAEGQRIPIPITEREVRPVPYFMSAHFPDDDLILRAAEDVVAQWDAVARASVAEVQGKSVDAVPPVFVICHNPVVAADNAVCGGEGFVPRPGDMRKSTLWWVESSQQLGPLGYGPAVTDPETGEIIAGRAYNYGDGLNTYAAYGLDVIRFMNGDLEPAELKNAQHIRADVLARAHDSVDLGKVSPKLREAPLGKVAAKDPSRMAQREERRHNLRRFDRDAALAKVERASEAGLSQMVGGPEFDQAVSASLGAPLSDLPPEVRANYDAARWLNPTNLKLRRKKKMAALARGIDYADMIDPNVLGLARSYAGRTDYDKIWRELRAAVFRATALHEMGHTLGLRHNFQGSYDALNYNDRYWELRKETLKPVETMFDLYALTTQSEAQIDGRMREYQYASIMDYGLTFNSDIQGLGKYDKAAFFFGYTAGSEPMASSAVEGGCTGDGRVQLDDGTCMVRREGLVEVFDKPRSELGDAGEILTTLDEYGMPFDDPHSVNVPYAERWHYTTVMQGFPEMADATSRRWMRHDTFEAARKTWAAAPDKGDTPVRVPYLFCSDEWVGALLSCQLFDGGADPFELTRNQVSDYRAYYYFANFKRDRLGWDPIDALFRYFDYTFLPMSDYFQNWYLAPEGYDDVMDNYWWLSINMGFNTIAETIATPPYGTFCETPDGRLFHLSDEPGQTPEQTSDYYLKTYCKPDGQFFEVAQGEGRRRFSIYDVDSGYNFGFLPLEAGHYWTTLAAFWALVDPEAYVLGTEADVGTFAISFYDFFGDEVHHLVNSVIAEDYVTYSPRLEVTGETNGAKTGTLHYPVMSPVWDADRRVLFNPETGAAVDDGAAGGGAALCEPCSADADCLGSTGAIGGTFCQPVEDGGAERYCLQDCTDDEGLCASDEVCDDAGNCVPDDGVCKVRRCSASNPYGRCDEGATCVEGACRAAWKVVESDATFSLVDDMVFYGMLYTTFGFSTRYNDQLNVFKLGTNETITPGEGFKVISFVDPIGGESYGAVVEDCGDGPTVRGGSTGLCQLCEGDAQCAGNTGNLGGTYCQPIADEAGDWFCFLDCTDDAGACPSGYGCDSFGNCVPESGSCDGLGLDCGPSNPYGACPEGETCSEGACVAPAETSARCQFGLVEPSGGAQLVLKGQEMVQRYDETLAAYWGDDGSDAEREAQLYRDFSRARYDLENLLSKLNDIRAVYGIFGKVY